MRMVGIAAGWGLLVVAAVSALQWGAGFWRDQREDFGRAGEQLRRLKGWVEVAPELDRRRQELLGSFAKASGKDQIWMSLQGLQQAASEAGLSVTELVPFEAPAGAAGRLDAKVEGTPDQINQFLQRLPEALPGLQLDSLQLIPRESGQIRGILRLKLFQEAR